MELDRANISQLSNDDLFKAMKKCGLTAGPVTSTTRTVYEKKLKAFLDNKENDLPPSTQQPPVIESLSTIEPVSIVVTKPKETKESVKTREAIAKAQEFSKIWPSPQQPPIQPIIETRTTTTVQQTKHLEPEITPRVVVNKQPESKIPTISSSKAPLTQTTTTTSSTRVIQPEKTHIQPSITRPATLLSRNDELYQNQRFEENVKTTTSSNNYQSSQVTTTIRPTETIPKPREEFKLIRPTISEAISIRKETQRTSIIDSPSTRTDKHAERLKSYGLLREDSTTHQPISTSTLGNSNIRSRPINIERVETPPQIKPESKPQVSARPTITPKPALSTTTAEPSQSWINWKQLLAVFIVTIIVYFVIINLQSNPENPVEF